VVEVSVIVPTYCEAENLPELTRRIHDAVGKACLSFEILIVDDNSPDDTPTVVAELAQQHPVQLIVRKEDRGLSSAVICGMDQARGKILVVIDADLSHPPEKIPALVRLLDDPNYDFAVGSRYVAGGSTADDWGLYRWFNSKVATLLARPFTSASDPMAGFFALRRDDFERARPHLNPVGYKIGLELMVKCGCQRVAETPIHFSQRFKGESKLNARQQVEYLHHLLHLWRYRYTPSSAAAETPHSKAA
jgi:dolichol-phosphate mannosyltransferase